MIWLAIIAFGCIVLLGGLLYGAVRLMEDDARQWWG